MREGDQLASGVLLNLSALVIIIVGVKPAASFLVPVLFAVFLATLAAPFQFWLTGKGVPSLPTIFIVILLFLLLEVMEDKEA